MITLQELFDSQSEFTPDQVGMLNSFTKLWSKYDHETNNDEFTDSYYKDLKLIADHYEVNYTEPKYRAGLKGVGSPITIQ